MALDKGLPWKDLRCLYSVLVSSRVSLARTTCTARLETPVQITLGSSEPTLALITRKISTSTSPTSLSTMASDSTHAHSHGNMVAQPVDPMAAQASRDSMSPGSLLAKEAKDDTAELSEDFNFSEDSPTKEKEVTGNPIDDPRLQEVQIFKTQDFKTPRSSPSPSRSKNGSARASSRTIPVKRSSSTPISSIPMIPRRGRVAISNAEL